MLIEFLKKTMISQYSIGICCEPFGLEVHMFLKTDKSSIGRQKLNS